jgi:CheY-like chemotaxis protein
LIDAGRTALSVLVVRRREMKLMTATATPTLSVLLVEDEVMIRMMIAEMLEELGHRVAAETGEIDQAIRFAQNTEFDLAILEITPVAELITALNRPIIFATGYGAAGIPEEFRGRPSLEKPFLVETLARTIDLTLRSHRSENEAP